MDSLEIDETVHKSEETEVIRGVSIQFISGLWTSA